VDQGQIDEQIMTRMLDERICNFLSITAPAYQGKPGGRKKAR